VEVGGMDAGVSGMLGRPDLASGYGYYMAQPIAGGGSNMNGSSGVSGGVSVSGNVATGQATLSLAAALVVLYMVIYFTSRGLQH
jgi:hypothetical protein